MMLFIIFVGLAILPLLIVCFGGLFLRSVVASRTLNFMIIAAAVITAVDMQQLYMMTYQHIELRQWVLVSELLALFPIYNSLAVIASAGVIYLFFEFNKMHTYLKVAASAVILLSAGLRMTAFSGTLQDFAYNKKFFKESLSAEQMEKIVREGSLKDKIILSTRADLTPQMIRLLLANENEIIRYYALLNPVVENADLRFLKDNDQSKEIRKQAGIVLKTRQKD